MDPTPTWDSSISSSAEGSSSLLDFLDLVFLAVVGTGGGAAGSVVVVTAFVDLNPGGALASTMAS